MQGIRFFFRPFRFSAALTVLVLFFAPGVSAQFNQLKNYNVGDGLPSSEVYDMMQDASGYLWFTTDMGVSRFDGYEFRNFSTENGMADNTIFGVYQDQKGRIWFTSFSGKLSYYYNGQIYSLPCNSKLENLVNGTIISSLYVDEGDTIWAGTTKNFILKINPGWEEKKLSRIEFPDREAYICEFGKKDFIYGGAKNAGKNLVVYERTNKRKQIIQLFSPEEKFNGVRFSIRRHENGDYLVTANQFAFYCSAGKVIARRELSSIGICTLFEKDGSIMTGTYNGVISWSGRTLSSEYVFPDFRQKVMTAICRDSEDDLWLCTEGNGVFCIPHRNFVYYSSFNGFSESKISCTTVCGNQVLSGHIDGTISVMKGKTINRIVPTEQTAFPNATNRISSILFFNQKEILVSTGNNIYSIDAEKFESKRVRPLGCKKIIASSDGNIWAMRFLSIVKLDRFDFHEIIKIPFSIYADNIYEDRSGKLWICAMNGLWTYDERSGLLYLGKENPLLASRIVDLREDEAGNLWMVSRGNGVIVKKGNEFIHIKKENGLAGNMCRSIYLDSGNIAWVGTNTGLSRIFFSPENKFTYSITTFSSQNGLLTNEVNEIIRQGKMLWLVHTNGISVFDPASLQSNKIPPPVYITGAIINGDSIRNDRNQFEYDQNYLSISFIGLSFKDPGDISYRYKMEGIDTGWVNTNYTSVNYQTLPPGEYRFLVSAQNNDGYWSKTPASVSFVILPAWWQTWIFKIAAGVILLMLVLLVFKLRLNTIRNREQKKALLQNRIASFELNALRAQMNPHFVFNAINSVQYFITNNDPDSSQKYLSKFARLIRYVVDNSKLASIPLKKETEALTLYLELEALRFGTRFEYAISIHPDVDPEYTQIPSMLIQPYVENAIWHGIMHKKGNGRIDIRIDLKGHTLRCIIEDNGIGRKQSLELKKAKGGETHQSVGMSNTLGRLEIINQVNDSNMSASITDLYDPEGKSCGTKVEIHIPIL